jgi:hypothetical protein
MSALETESPWYPHAKWSAESELAGEAEWGGQGESGPAGSQSEAAYELESPFLSGVSFVPTLPGEQASNENYGGDSQNLYSPFLGGMAAAGEVDHAGEFGQLLGQLEDEQFDEAVARLADEAAALHLASETSWSSPEVAPSLASSELETWVSPLAAESDRLLETMASRLTGEDLETFREPELESLLESMRPDSGFLSDTFEQFLGGLFNKAKSLVKGAVNLAKKGIQTVGKILPVGWLLDKLKVLVRPLLRRVLERALGMLPVSLQPLARRLASQLLGEAESEAEGAWSEHGNLVREFDIQAASLMFAGDQAEAEGIVAEAEAEAAQQASGALAKLDAARARLGERLTEMSPGEAPVAELEQFIPAVMAVLPAVRLGISVIGRDKVVGFLADKIASLIRGQVGPDAAQALARPIVDAGLRMLTLEAPPAGEATLAGEALASATEDTVREVLELPGEAFEDPLRLEAEVREAFGAAAARYVPAERLRPDLAALEIGGDGVWILMPRAARPTYRYKKFSRIFVVPISRQVARAVPTTDGGTLEAMLLDRGVTEWPAHGEIHLYETMPGSHLGHIAQFEAETESAAAEALDELQPLTPEAAGLLLREPQLGRPLARSDRHHGSERRDRRDHRREDDRWAVSGIATRPLGAPPASPQAPPPIVTGPGAAGGTPAPVLMDPHAAPLARPLPAAMRMYRVALPGLARRGTARPRKRLHVEFDSSPRTPAIRVHLHLSEREAQQLAERLSRRDLPGAVAWLKHRYHRALPAVLTARLVAKGGQLLGAVPSNQLASDLALRMTEGVTQALSHHLGRHHHELTEAARNPAQGLTLSFAFTVDPAELARGQVRRPRVKVKPGQGRG